MVNLVKGQKVELTKSNPGLTKINAGLGWAVSYTHLTLPTNSLV